MWEKIEMPLPEDLENVTTSVWKFCGKSDVVVGVMRPLFLRPPFLWMQISHLAKEDLRKANYALDSFQSMLDESIVFAEAQTSKSCRFLLFAGFKTTYGNTFYERRL